MKYKLERRKYGVWHFGGVYSNPVRLVEEAFRLRHSGYDSIRVIPMGEGKADEEAC